MGLSKERRVVVYRKLLNNLYRGDNISKAIKDVGITREGVNLLLSKLSNQGIIFLTSGEKGKTFVNFTIKGHKFLEEFGLNTNSIS